VIEEPVAGPSPASADPPAGSSEPYPIRIFLLQLLITGIGVTAIQAARPMVTYRAIGLGAGPVEIGLVQSAFSIIPVFTAVAIGRWVDRLGEVRILAFGMTMISVGGIVLAMSGSLLVLAIGQCVIGLGEITHIVSSQALVANRGPRDRREHRYGTYSMVVSLGQLAGPAIGALLVGGTAGLTAIGAVGAFGWLPGANAETPVFLFTSLAAGVAFVLALFLPHHRPRRPEPALVTAPVPNLGHAAWLILRRPGMAAAMFVSIAVISAVDVLVAYLPAYGQASGLGVETVGALLSVRAGSSLVSRIFMGRLIDTLGREKILFLSTALAGGAILLLPFVGSTPALFGLMILIGAGLGLGQPMTLAWVANRSPRQDRGMALGVRLTGNRLGLLITPIVMGVLAGAAGITAIFVVLAGFLGIGSFVARRTPFDDLAAGPPSAAPSRSP
jgi:MFS family permease